MDAWNNLSNREKSLVGIGLPLVLLIIFYLYFWQPTRDELNRLRHLVPEKTATLAWMQHQLNQPQNNQATSNVQNKDAPLLTIIENVAIETAIHGAIQRVQPGSSGEVEIWYQEVVADQLFLWIDKLALNAVSVESATVTRATPGLVSARVKVNR